MALDILPVSNMSALPSFHAQRARVTDLEFLSFWEKKRRLVGLATIALRSHFAIFSTTSVQLQTKAPYLADCPVNSKLAKGSAHFSTYKHFQGTTQHAT